MNNDWAQRRPTEPGVGTGFDIFTGGAALLTNRCLVGVVVESLKEASADLVAALPHLNSNDGHFRLWNAAAGTNRGLAKVNEC